MIRALGVLMSLGVVAQAQAYDARFQRETGMLEIPYVRLTNGDPAVFELELSLTAAAPPTFGLGHLGMSRVSGINGPTYDLATNVLQLPRVLVGTRFFSATLVLNGDGELEVTAGQANPYPVKRNQHNLFAYERSAVDSQPNADGSSNRTRAYLHGTTRYHVVQTRTDDLGQPVTVAYAVHEAEGVATPKALVILIPGGSFQAYLSGDAATGRLDASGGNFNIRTAHFYAQLGFRAISLDRASDALSFYGGGSSGGSFRYDDYRISPEARTDVAAIISRENAEGLPVFIVGTSRGAISAIALSHLADGISLSSPVTRSRAGGHPIGYFSSSERVQPEYPQVPIHLMYHVDDACTGTRPENTVDLYQRMVGDGKDVTLHGLSGGFVDTVDNDVCGARSYHGFLGIDSAAAAQTAAWMEDVLAHADP